MFPASVYMLRFVSKRVELRSGTVGPVVNAIAAAPRPAPRAPRNQQIIAFLSLADNHRFGTSCIRYSRLSLLFLK